VDWETFRRTPKAELHVHLEGALKPSRALAFAAETSDHPWRSLDLEGLRARLKGVDFPAFIERFMEGYRLLRNARHFQIAVEDLCESLVSQGVVYAEILYSPGIYIQRLGLSLRDIHDGIAAGLRQFPGLRARFVVDTVLNMGAAFMARTLEATLADRRDFLGGFSVGGGAPELDMRAFVPLFHRAQEAGLFCVAHAGEVDGIGNIEILARETDVRRIAHGCAAGASPETLRLLRDRGIGIDVSLTSNLCTGAVADLARHPLPRFLEHGVRATLNTDDPFYFDTDLFGEYRLAQEAFGLSDETLKRIMADSLAAASD